MPLTPLETALYNLAELAAVEDKPPFVQLLRKPGSKPTGNGDESGLIRLRGRGVSTSGRTVGED